MSLKMMKNTLLVSAFAAVSVLAGIGCGDSEDKDDSGGGGNEDAGPGNTDTDGGAPVGPATRTRSGTLVPVTATDTSAPIKVPHKIVVLEALTGKPLEPALSAMTSSEDGTWTIKDIPTKVPVAFHVQGTGPVDVSTSTYDSVLLNITATSADDALTRISSVGTANFAGMVAGYMNDQATGAVTVGLYMVRDGKRVGTVGCAEVYVDDKLNPFDLRYVGSGGLPSPITMQTKTEKTRGALLVPNIPKGEHTIKATVDGGKTFFGETKIYIGMTRNDAVSPFKSILYQLAIEIEGDNKTPSDCN